MGPQTDMLVADEVRDIARVLKALNPKKMNADEIVQTVIGLVEFTFIFRKDDGLASMCRFIGWAYANNQPDSIVEDTLIHDIYGRREKMFSPRTSSYKEV